MPDHGLAYSSTFRTRTLVLNTLYRMHVIITGIKSMEKSICGFRILFLHTFLLISAVRVSTDTLTPGQSIRDRDVLVSADGSFELGFFSPINSKGRYLGIWYHKISAGTVVWVANRETPLNDSSGALIVTDQGILILLNSSKDAIWSSNASRTAQNPVMKLLGSGNLVVKDINDSSENFLWQSFDYPCDTLLPGMKWGRNMVTGLDRYLSSWKSSNDPAQGEFTFRIDPRGNSTQMLLMKGTKILYRTGTWNGLRWTGTPQLKPNMLYTYGFTSTATEMYYKFDLINSSVSSRIVMNSSGIAQRFSWITGTNIWARFSVVLLDQCDEYALCGAYGSCNVKNQPVCACLEGFIPKSPEDWSIQDWSDGCVRRTKLDCDNRDRFLPHKGVKLPDMIKSWVDTAKNLKECEDLCLKNCSCVAYANSDVREGGNGCILWLDELIDTREFPEDGQDLYMRIAASEFYGFEKNKSSDKKQVGIIAGTIITIVGVLVLAFFLYARRKKLRKQATPKSSNLQNYKDEGQKEEDMELPKFDLITVADATDNFSSRNKLGEGGFGSVYKGTLTGGQEVAVKRLSKNSGQGLTEFKNEVILIAKLQHRNLVKLLGCCIEGDERMLIYEYMTNKSLDYFIFDQKTRESTDWRIWINIIGGIARGLLYLHQDSRLRIIHRDLKASNVLLDNGMDPKISDFGMARTFRGDQTEANTNKIVGTFGYMSPEYAVDGLFSLKSDVFSFGVLILEIVSGKKNRGFNHPDHHHNLLGHAWRLWNEERPLELINEPEQDSCTLSEIIRCIHVGLLCVQQRPEDRPNMSSVIVMLSSEIWLPQPKQPGFFTERNLPEGESSSGNQKSCCTNEITVSLQEPR